MRSQILVSLGFPAISTSYASLIDPSYRAAGIDDETKAAVVLGLICQEQPLQLVGVGSALHE